ncbi:MAG TPA: GGDEF domain-containing protein, partial [Gaiellaceae bacterium]|nr:GGDEF domain-containing protein [Gaiellaceae bacterium]
MTVAGPQDGALASFFNVWVYNGLMLLAVAIAAARTLAVREDRAAWTAFTAGLASWSFGELWYAAVQPESFPSVADAGFLGFYPCAYVGMVLLLRGRARGLGGALWLDGLVSALAASALGAAVLVELVLGTTQGSLSTVATNLAYPLGDLLLLSAVFGVLALTGWRLDRRWLLLGLGLLSTAVADGVYLFQSAEGTYVEGTWVDVLWPLAMLLVALAALVDDRGRRLELAGRPLLAVPTGGAAVGIGILVWDHFQRTNLLALVLAAATVATVVVRLGLTFRENRRLYELTREESVTDALTGLGNRRRLVRDLEDLLAERDRGSTLLMLFDLDGFKTYNDTFGHPAGDALLAHLGARIAAAVAPQGTAYRLGGDEFCVLADVRAGEAETIIDRACEALTEHGEGFHVSTSFGAVVVPDDAEDASEALRMADERLYAQKYSRRGEGDRTLEALLDAL